MKKIMLLAISIALFSCSKKDDPITPPPATNSIAYFKASLNGQLLDYTAVDLVTSAYSYDYYNGYQSGPGYFDKSYHFGGNLQPSIATDYYPQIGLTFSNMYNTNSGVSQTDAFYGLFATVPTNFITSAQLDGLIKGIDVSYTNQANENFSTLYGNQTGSTMTVLSSVTGVEPLTGLKIITLVGTVSCKLYNENLPTDLILLTNGTYKIILREDY